MSLSLSTSSHTCLLQVTERIRTLVAKQHAEVQRAIEDGIGVKWESHRLDAYVRFLADAVLNFEVTVSFFASYPPPPPGVCDCGLCARPNRLLLHRSPYPDSSVVHHPR